MTMKRLVRLTSTLVAVFMMLLLTTTLAFASDGVNWEESTITVKGMGLMPQNVKSPAQARMLARRAAVVDGYRLLAELIKGVNVDAETTVENLAVRSDTVRTKVSACIQGASVVSENEIPEGYEVTMQIQMFGDSNPLAAAVIPRPEFKEPFPKPDESVEPSKIEKSVESDVNTQSKTKPDSTKSSLMISNTVTSFSASDYTLQSGLLPLSVESSVAVSEKPVKKTRTKKDSSLLLEKASTSDEMFTGLVVDCRGLGLNCAMSPVVKNKKGEAIYGHKNLDYDLVISKGMVSYSTDINNYDRAGSKPLVVKAIALENFNGNPIISVADANRVLIENQKAGFLDQMNVVFVR